MEATEEPTLKRQKLVIMDNPNEQPPTLPEVPADRIDLGALKFRQLCKKCWYVDKIMLIKTLVGPRPTRSPGTLDILRISAPRRFGKSTNMDMLKSFIENREELKVENRKLFEDKNIFKEVEFFEEHFGKYPVIYVNFVSFSGENFEKYLDAFREILNEAFEEHCYLLNSEKLSENNKKTFNRYYCDDKYGSLNEAQLVVGLKRLSQYLYKHFDRKAYILIDELDAPVSTGLYQNNLSKDELTRVIIFISRIITALLKDNEFVGYGLLNTCHHIGGVVSAGANNVIPCPFLSKSICRFYGFTEEEVNYLLKMYGVKEEEVKAAKDWYNGYSATDEAEKDVQVYSNWSILRYLSTRDIKSYWSSCCLNRLKKIMLHNVIETKIQKLMDEHIVDINYIEKPEVEHVEILKKMINCSSSIIEESDADLFMQFLFENGLFNAIPQPEQLQRQRRLKIPNNEILQEFQDTLYSLDFFKR